MIEIYNLKDKPELLDIVVQLFWGQWGSSTNYSFKVNISGNNCFSTRCKRPVH
jgi:hypothetical protein